MNTQELKASLTTEQAAAFNAALIEQRDGLVAIHLTNLRENRTAAAAEIDAGKAHIAELTDLMGKAAKKSQDDLAAKDAEIDLLKNPKVAPAPPLISQLHEAFMAAIPAELRPQFAAPYAIVRTLIQAEQYELAVEFINSVAVPPGLEDARAGLVELIRGN